MDIEAQSPLAESGAVDEVNPAPNPAPNVYILFAYKNYVQNSSKYVMGIYNTYEEAFVRIISLCEKLGYKQNHHGAFYSSDGSWTYFINILPMGDQYTELFTTLIRSPASPGASNTVITFN